MKTTRLICYFLTTVLAYKVTLADSLRCKEISEIPFTISSPGKYCLLQNLTVPLEMTDPAVSIQSSDVQISLNGFTLEKASNGFGIVNISQIGFSGNGVERITIYDGNVRGFNPAINLSNTSSSTISNLKISKFDLKGIEVSGNNISILNNHLKNYSYRTGGYFVIAGNTNINSNTIKLDGNYFSANAAALGVINLIKFSSASITNNNFDCGNSSYRIRHLTGASSLSSYEYPKINHNVSNCIFGDNAVSLIYGSDER